MLRRPKRSKNEVVAPEEEEGANSLSTSREILHFFSTQEVYFSVHKSLSLDSERAR